MIHIALTLDQEWCPTAVFDWVREQLDRTGVRVTFFATDAPDADFGPHEIALHPNPFRDSSLDVLSEIKRLLEKYPDAKGVRTHRLFWHSSLDQAVEDLGMQYASNMLLPGQSAGPTRISSNLIHFPLFYMDHHELVHPEMFQPGFSVQSLPMEDEHLYVFDFHPNMLFTNAPDDTFYQNIIRANYQDAAALARSRFPGRGCHHLFQELLALRNDGRYRFITMSEAVSMYRAECGKRAAQ